MLAVQEIAADGVPRVDDAIDRDFLLDDVEVQVGALDPALDLDVQAGIEPQNLLRIGLVRSLQAILVDGVPVLEEGLDVVRVRVRRLNSQVLGFSTECPLEALPCAADKSTTVTSVCVIIMTPRRGTRRCF